jgi:hypothetical protein
MWESRVLCEISKRRWESFCDFHGRVMSTAGSGLRIASLIQATDRAGASTVLA